MANYRVSPSMLESYRLYLNEDWMTTERFVEGLTSFVETPEMRLGTAVHRYIEDGTESDEFLIDYSSIDPVISDITGFMVHEMRGSKILHTMYGDVIVNAISDAVVGNKMYEWKTTAKSLQMGKYHDSVQWKLCAWVFGFSLIEYRAMQLAKDKKSEVWSVKNWDRLPLVWSDPHFREIQFLVDGVIGFCINQKLEECIQPKYMAGVLEVA